MKLKIQVFQHVPFEGPGFISSWAEEKNASLSVTHVYQNQTPPAPSEYDWLIVMGGPMGANDDAVLSWMSGEKAAIQKALDANKPILGICLGAQLLANILGAKVYPNAQREIGWFPIEASPSGKSAEKISKLYPGSLEVFHWHGDTFELAPGMERIFSSSACENQAYVYNENVIGLQFHLETTPSSARALIDNGAEDYAPGIPRNGAFVSTPEKMLARPERFTTLNGYCATLLDFMLKQIG